MTERSTRSLLSARYPFGLSVVAEEISEDLRRTLPVARELGISRMEFGTLWGEQMNHVSSERLVVAQALLERHNLSQAGLRAQLVAPKRDDYAGCVSIEIPWSPPNADPGSDIRSIYAALMNLLDDIYRTTDSDIRGHFPSQRRDQRR